MFILCFRLKVVKTPARCFVRILLFQKVEVEQQSRGGMHVAAQLNQLRIGILRGNRSQERLEGFEIFSVERFLLIFRDVPLCHALRYPGTIAR